jgi:hypothetical protein
MIATEWVPDPTNPRLEHPAEGKARAWVDSAVDPGIKGTDRAREKMKNDYDSHANKLKDLVRCTLSSRKCHRLVEAHTELGRTANITVLGSKNNFASPTPMGYSDINLSVGVNLDGGTEYVCELQLNVDEMLDAKRAAHSHYEEDRKVMPSLCQGTNVDPGKLEAFIIGRLSNSALDAAVAVLSKKAEGLFLYASLLAQHLESERNAGQEIRFSELDSLPAGLSEVYAVNFRRAFPNGSADAKWKDAQLFVELIAAAMEPLAVTMVELLLGWSPEKSERVREATALLFPERDGKFHVFHKTVVDWLTGEVSNGSSVSA